MSTCGRSGVRADEMATTMGRHASLSPLDGGPAGGMTRGYTAFQDNGAGLGPGSRAMTASQGPMGPPATARPPQTAMSGREIRSWSPSLTTSLGATSRTALNTSALQGTTQVSERRVKPRWAQVQASQHVRARACHWRGGGARCSA